MKKDYLRFSESEKLKYWEGMIAHKIRSQAEAGGDPDSAITEEFVDNCKKQDSGFPDFIPALSLTFPVMKKYIRENGKKIGYDPLKKWVLVFAAVLFFGIQILLIFKEGYAGMIFAGIVNSIMGIVFYIGIRINSGIKKIYRSIAETTGLNFRYSTGGLPGFLYDPGLEGFYNGFQVSLIFENKWTGRWIPGQNGLGQAQRNTRSVLGIKLPGPVSPDIREKISEVSDQINLKGDLSFNDNSIGYEVVGAINSEKMKDDLLNALNIITNTLFKAV